MESVETNSGSEPRDEKRASQNHSAPRGPSVLTVIAAAFWLCVVVGAMIAILHAANVPGVSGEAPSQWPAQSRIPLDPTQPTLVLFAHPHCPCTRASVGELNQLMARVSGKCKAYAVFIQPEGFTEDWTQTALWREASAIPGVTVRVDAVGVEASNFHAETSGQTVLYDPQGHLLFEGGITISRGHSGDNPGRSALVGLLDHELSRQVQTPVFGCSLFDHKCRQGEVQ